MSAAACETAGSIAPPNVPTVLFGRAVEPERAMNHDNWLIREKLTVSAATNRCARWDEH